MHGNLSFYSTHDHPQSSMRQSSWARVCVMVITCLHGAVSSLMGQTAASAASSQSLVGDWIFVMEGDPQPQRVKLAVEGDSLRGRVYGQLFAVSTAKGAVSFRVGDFRWRARVQGDSLVGWLGVDPDSSRWVGVRESPSRAARSMTLAPRSYSRAFAVTTPALRLVSGDTVTTSTVDAGGWGRGAYGDRRNKLTDGGNPLVGPFYVEHALPGDVLEVTLHKVALNRGWAFSGTWLVDNAIETSYATRRVSDPQRVDNTWVLDTVMQRARRTTDTGALAGYTVPLTPFLGVIATAPSNEFTPSSRESGSYGGNMENRYMRSGTTVLLPVSQRGAYLYIGDGHAAQGDGETTGDAMETSLDVTFSVKVRRWGFQNIVRAETDTHLLSHGVGGSVDEAMRRATSDLASWLETRYKLTSSDVAVLLGFSMQYEIADVVAPGFGVIARVPKAALPNR